MFADPEVVRYLYDDPVAPGDALAHMAARLERSEPEEGKWFNLAVHADGMYVGEMGLLLTSAVHHQFEIGYVFDARFFGRGYATEAASCIVALAFEEFEAHRVCARLDARNEKSARLAARLGLKCEARLRENEFVKGVWTDEEIYAIRHDEWVLLARHGPDEGRE